MTAAKSTDDPLDVPSIADDPDVSFGEDQPADGVLYSDPEPGGPVPPTVVPQDEPEPGTRDERELWRAQQDLIDEDDKMGLKLEGFSEEGVPAVLDALGDDAAEVLPDSPNGTSATGTWTEPEHGGFPERRD